MKNTYIKPKLDIVIEIPVIPDVQDGVTTDDGNINIGGKDSEVIGDGDNDA